jgi:uncharacterized membrane protein YebE (DUF533 family)
MERISERPTAGLGTVRQEIVKALGSRPFEEPVITLTEAHRIIAAARADGVVNGFELAQIQDLKTFWSDGLVADAEMFISHFLSNPTGAERA